MSRSDILLLVFLLALLRCADAAADFTVCPSSSAISSPENGDVWYPFVEQTIVWDPSQLPFTTVTIELWEADQVSYDDMVATISATTENDGSFNWTPENFIDDGALFTSEELYIFISEPAYDAFSDSLAGYCFELDATAISSSVTDTLVAFSVSSEFAEEATVQVWPTSDTSAVRTNSHDFPDQTELFSSLLIFDELEPSTAYSFRYRLSYEDGAETDWIVTSEFTTEARLECSLDVIAAFFSQAAYYDWDTSVPSFEWCQATWETAFVYNVGADHVFLHRADTRQLVLSHRGTEIDNPNDIFDNLNLNFVPCPTIGCTSGAEVGSFSLDDYLTSNVNGLRSSLAAHRDAGYRLLLHTGHSQGAALATLGLMDASQTVGGFDRYDMVTFGSPRPGNQEYVDQLATITTYSRLYVQQDSQGSVDLVTSVPPLGVATGVPTFLPCPGTPGAACSICHCMLNYMKGTFDIYPSVDYSSDTNSIGSPASNSNGSPSSGSPASNSNGSPASSFFSSDTSDQSNASAVLPSLWALLSVTALLAL